MGSIDIESSKIVYHIFVDSSRIKLKDYWREADSQLIFTGCLTIPLSGSARYPFHA
jgi:hypothetical protein